MKQTLANSLSAAALVIVSGIVATSVQAKDSLINLDNAQTGGFGGPVFKASQIKGKETFEIGGIGGATFTTGKHQVMLGGGGFGLTNELKQPNDESLEVGYGGFIMGYTFNPKSVVHVETHLLMGAGGASLIDASNDVVNDESGWFYITELTTKVEVNVTEFMEIGLGASYRVTTDPDMAALSSGDLSGFGMVLSFQFGAW